MTNNEGESDLNVKVITLTHVKCVFCICLPRNKDIIIVTDKKGESDPKVNVMAEKVITVSRAEENKYCLSYVKY